MPSRCYLTTATPPGSLLELVQADVLARHRRLRGSRVWFLAGEASAELREPLALSFTDFIRGDDARHAPGAEKLRRGCADAGDLYDTHVFRLSRYAGRLHDLISSGALRIEPATHRDDVLGFIANGLADVSIHSWDPLAGYLTGLGYGTDGPLYQRWWLGSDRRVHVIGKEALHLHAVYWPAILLSVGAPLPTDILVQDRPAAGDVSTLARQYGADVVRWWLLRDTDFTATRLVARANKDLAGDLGKLVDQIVVMVHRYRAGRPPAAAPSDTNAERLVAVCRAVPEHIDDALAAFDFRRATAAAWRIVEEVHRYLKQARPWELARAEGAGDAEAGRRLDAVLAVLLAACRTLADELTPFVPTLAARIFEQSVTLSDSLPQPRTLFRRLPDDRNVSRGSDDLCGRVS